MFLSSRAVYGTHPQGTALDETMTSAPDTLYGEVKLEAEKALAAMSDAAMAGVSLRVTGVYGPAGPGRDHKWAALFADYLSGRPITPRAGTEVHGRDVGAAVGLMLEVPAADVSTKVFNVSDVLVDRRDLLAIVRETTGCPHALPPAAETSGLNVMDCARLRGLGWEPGGRVLLECTVRRMAGAIAK